MSPDELNRKLLEYLEDGKNRRTVESQKIDQLIATVSHLADNQNLTDRKIDLFAVEVREQIKGMQARVSKLEDDAEDTGKHDISQLQERLRAEQTSAKAAESAIAAAKAEADKKVADAKAATDKAEAALSRTLGYIIAAIGGLSLLGLGGAGTVVWYLITHGH